MDMKERNCHLFEMNLRIPHEAFNKDAFLDDLKDFSKDIDVYFWSFGSQSSPGQQNAEMGLDFRPRKHIKMRVVYHQIEKDITDKRPPYMEDCVQWLARFIDQVELKASMRIVYDFDSEFSPKARLPFPLLSVVDEPELEGAEVTGIIIQFAGHEEAKEVIIQREDETTFIEIRAVKEVNVKEFDLFRRLDELAPFVSKFISKKGEA
jgi:hypothetical protein